MSLTCYSPKDYVSKFSLKKMDLFTQMLLNKFKIKQSFKFIRFLFFTFILFLFSTDLKAQSNPCTTPTPIHSIDLSSSPDAVYTSPSGSSNFLGRAGACCPNNESRCLVFFVELHENAVGVKVEVIDGTNGPTHYRVGCGSNVAMGSVTCVNGPGIIAITCCRSGTTSINNSRNRYRITSYGGPSVSVSPNPAVFCSPESSVLLSSNVSGGTPPYIYAWHNAFDGGGSVISTSSTYTATSHGDYSLLVYDNSTVNCPSVVNVPVLSTPLISVSPPNPYLCDNTSLILTASGADSYTWSPSDELSTTEGNIVSVSPSNDITYTVTGSVGACTSSVDIDVMVCKNDKPIILSNDATICVGGSVQLSSSNALEYEWTPTTGLNNPNIANPIASPTTTTTYYLNGFDESCNLIYNGDFQLGNVGFYSDYNYSSNLVPEGNYMIGGNPRDYHSNFATCNDHTPGNPSMMMVVNGAPTANQKIWCQDVAVIPNTDYVFSTWLTSVHPTNPAILQFSINGELLGSPFAATATTCQWNQFYATWNSGSETMITICIVNQNTIAAGNDFAIDDIFFSPLCSQMADDSVVVTVVPDPTIITQPLGGTICVGGNFTLEVDAIGGTPSLTYQWQSSNNAGGPWSNIAGATSSTYTTSNLTSNAYYRVRVSASGNGCDNVFSVPALVTVVPDPAITVQPLGTTICEGGTHTMSVTASGGAPSLTYQWQSSPDGTNWTDIAGATNNTYTTPVLTVTTHYQVIV
ncbi:MAG: hypothetical protein GX879_00560, partial [Bacteroidales bacterium]|nr:hypothetical protein [Bacteroidales bacterium]